ncbi:MAG: hypothetical protein IK101_01090 [Oscillospiraceae bacterium]|nr:hypothetical protein [Oscillospiraceae bacterium]
MKHTIRIILILALALALVLSLAACAKTPAPAPTAEPAPTTEPTSEPAPTAEPTATPEPTPAPSRRQPGERFEETIILEGMEETIKYEHVRSDELGFEIDYDYERFERRAEGEREIFVSIWDEPADPLNYLELTARTEDAETVAAEVRDALSGEFELLEHPRELDLAGECIYIEASSLKNGGGMPDRLQIFLIVPAADGCRVATEHLEAEASEGFGRRFGYMLNTLIVIPCG